MALNRAKLADAQQVASSAGALITNAASTKTWIRGIVLHNTSASTAITVKLYNVPDSGGAVGTAAASNQFFEKEIAIAGTHYIDLPGPGFVLSDTNDTIQGEDGVGSTVSIWFIGDNETV
jgi:hypothetical protein